MSAFTADILPRVCFALERTLSASLALGLRLWLASIFFASGLTKFAGMQTTIALFTYEYQVPLLSPVIAAYLATGLELLLPILLVLGLLTRAAALLLFLFNTVAALSYPDISDAGIQDHLYWGMLMLVLVVHGSGWLAMDQLPFIRRHKGKLLCASPS